MTLGVFPRPVNNIQPNAGFFNIVLDSKTVIPQR